MQIQSSYSITYLMRQQTNLPFRLCTTGFCPGTVELISLVEEALVLQRWETPRAVYTSSGDHTQSFWELWSEPQFLLLLPFALLTHCRSTARSTSIRAWAIVFFQLLKKAINGIYYLSWLLITLQKFAFHLTFPTTSLPSSISPPQKSCCIKLSFKYVFNMNNKCYIQSQVQNSQVFFNTRILQNGNTNFHKTKAVSYFLIEVKTILTQEDWVNAGKFKVNPRLPLVKVWETVC